MGMALYLIFNPTRTGVVPNYRMAATNWWAGWKIYGGSGTHGFLYFPPFVVLFTPYNLIRPQVVGEILWRLSGFALFVRLLWELTSTFNCKKTHAATFCALVFLAVPASLASINNGQTNLPLSACLGLAAIALSKERWWLASILLVVCVILKPIALAPLLLAFAVFPQARGPLALGFLGFALVGVAHPDLGYALDRWQKCLIKIFLAYHPENLRVSDLFNMLEKFRIQIPDLLRSLTRLAASFGALAYVAWNHRNGSRAGSWALWVASTLLFTILNPRVETNSYVLISPLLAFTALCYLREGGSEKWKGVVLAVACIGLMCDGMGKTIYRATDVWLKPLIVLVVSPLLLRMPDGWKLESERREG